MRTPDRETPTASGARLPAKAADGYNTVIVGGGIIGLALAREMVARGKKSIAIFEKEPKLGVHASGRNSGVLHAGLYYAPDSLKARFCADGARMMKEYVRSKGLPLLETGKVVVARDGNASEQLENMYGRALKNGIRVEKISKQKLAEIEPEARTHEFAIHSPDTAVVDSKRILASLEEELVSAGVRIFKGSGISLIERDCVLAGRNRIRYGNLINAAGLQADRIAHAMGYGKDYRIAPFKGLYWKLKPDASARYKGLIYPAPDLRVPFLGVHLTKAVDGSVSVGPTAIPALGRENYGWLKGFRPLETPRILWDLASMYAANRNGFRNLVREELPKFRAAGIVRSAREMAPSLKMSDLSSETKVGLRAQLIRARDRELIMDFVVEKGDNSLHVLNAVSPGFTSSFAFARQVISDWIG